MVREKEWDITKTELLKNIKQTKELGTTDPEILEIMEEILNDINLSNSLIDYYNNTKGD